MPFPRSWNYGKIMVVAGLPSPSKRELPARSATQDAVLRLMAEGFDHTDIARRIAKGDQRKAKLWRTKIRRWAVESPAFQQGIREVAAGTFMIGLPTVAEAVSKRASRGRMDAAKVVMAQTGFHNEKVSHEHGGEIQINVSIPRPPAVEDRLGLEEPIVDADVVEDD